MPDPENTIDYAVSAAEALLEQVGISNFNNVTASMPPPDNGRESIYINLDQDVTYESQEFYIFDLSFTFSNGIIETKTFPLGIRSEIKDAFSDTNLNLWYQYSSPDKQEDDNDIQSNLYTYEDSEGTIWSVVDKDEGGVWSSTATGSNGDTRVTSNSWNDSTQTNTYTEVFVSASTGVNSTVVEATSPSSVTKTYTGASVSLGPNPLHELYTNLSVVETLDQYWNTTNITGTGDNSDGDTVEFTYVNYELLVDGDPIATDFGFDDMFSDDQTAESWEWVDDWNNTIWVVVEENKDGNWVMTETGYDMDDAGNRGDANGSSRTSYSSWDDSNNSNTWTMTEVTPDFNFTRVEVYNDDGTSSETITGKFDQIGWYFLGQTYEGINATVTRDVNWNITSISGTVQDPDDASLTLAVTYSNNDISIDGKSVSDIQDDQPHFEEGGQNTWTWTDWDGVTWTVVDEEINGVWTSTETSSNNDVRTHTSSWDDATGSSTMTETYASGNLELNYSREEIWNSDGTSTENITGTTNQLGWMWLDEIYVNVNVTIEHTWEGMTLNGSGVRQSDTNRVDFGLNEHDDLVTSTDGGTTWSSIDFSGNDDFNSNESESWESSWEWMDWDNSVWVVTDSQQGETWSSTEIQYTDDTKTTATGAERMHSSTWNERTQTNIWTDSEKSADGSIDFQRIETQRADGSSTETLIGKTDKFDADDINVTIERDSNWEITDISGTADGAPVGFENGNITVNGVALENFQGDGGHANMESSESSWTWTDWDGTTWTVTDKMEGDTWTSTEVGSNGEIRTHKNTWSGDTETWSETYTRADGTSVSRVEVRNSNDDTSTETITGQDNHFGWWDFDTAYTGLEVTIERDSNWNITSVSGSADGDVTFGFTDGGLTINGDPFQSGGDDRSNHMQEAYVNTWEWQDGNGVTWTVTDKQDGDTWTSTEEGSNGDVRINSNAWDSDVDDYVYTTSFKSGTDDRDYTIRETWNADGSSTEVIKGATDQINWIYLGETYTDVEVTIVRNQNWETLSVTGSGTDTKGTADPSDDVTATFSWDTDNNQLSFNSVVIEDTNFSGGGQAEESWSSEWEWTDWEGILWSVVESQVGDVWTSTETGDNGAVRVFESRWNPIKQTSIWSESYDEDSSTDADGQHLDYTRVETYNPNGTSSETITGSTDNIAWYPLHGIYTNVSVTIERDDSWDIFKVYGTGTDPDGNTADFSWFQDQIVFGDAATGDMNIIENPDDFKVDENQYWENTSEWEDWDGTTWVVTEIQDGSTYTRSETNAERGDSRVETNVWDHNAQTNTRTMKETNSDRGIDVEEISIWNSATETETTNITGTTDHIDWMPLNGPTLVDITLTYDNTHNITAAEGDVTIDSNVKELTYIDGQFLFDNEALTVSWVDWDGSVWEMSQTQDGDTWIRTETAVSGDQTGAKRIESHNWDHATQTQTMTEIVTDSTANGNAEISNVTRVQSFTDGGGSTEVITGSTNHIEWMQLGEIYTFNEPGLTITRDGDWNIKSIEGMGTNSNGDVVPIGFSPNDNQLMINNELVADDIGQTFENTWTWEDGDGTTWTVVDKQSGNTWTSTETGSNGDVRVMESSWDDETQTNTWSESYTNAAKTIDFTKTEVYDENAGTSTMTTTGTSDHIGWMYVGEIYTKIDVTETRDANWDTTGLSGTATNAAGDEVSIGWNDGITVDGDMLMTHGPGDFSMSADNFQNEWTFFDHEGIEWTVVESQQGDAWISEETNEFGDVRTNTNYWDNETNSSKNVTKFKTAPDENGLSDINYKMTETWNDDGSSVLEISGDTDHIGWDYVGEVYTDIDVVITRNSNWEIQSVTTAGLVEGGTAKNEEGDSVTISFDGQNPNDLLIDGVSIYRMGDDFYKDFDGDMMDQMDMMHQTGSWEFSYTNPEGHEIDVVEEAVVTDLITIKTTDLDISLVFELSSDDGGGYDDNGGGYDDNGGGYDDNGGGYDDNGGGTGGG
ncbi:hypothetical protein CL630_03690, partial [bacterium]|nr:hypothetical protein [bacterium]